MALAASVLTSAYDNVDRTSYPTASISPAANSLLLVFYHLHATSTAGTPTVSGLSLTWNTIITSLDGIKSQGAFWAQCGASPGSGALTLGWTGGDATGIGASWVVVQVTGHNTTTPIPQSKLVGGDASTSTAPTGTLTNAIGNSGNRVFSAFSHRANEVTNPRTNWTELDDKNGNTPNSAFEVQWRNDGTNETTFGATWTSSSRFIGHGVEVAVSTGTTGTAGITLDGFANAATGRTVQALATLTDTFDTALDKTTKWPQTSASVVWDSSTRAKIPCTSSYYVLGSAVLYNLTGSKMIAQVFPATGGTGTRETFMSVLLDANNKVEMYVSGTTFACRKVVGGTPTVVQSTTYNATTHGWWCIRETGGTIFFDYSADGNTWTNLGSTTVTFAYTYVWGQIASGYYGTESAADTYVDSVGVAGLSATAAITLGNFTAAGTGTVGSSAITGSAAITLAGFTAAGTGAERFSGSAAITLNNFTPAGTGAERFSGSAGITLNNFVTTTTAVERFTGTSAITLNNFTCAATGTNTPPAITGTAAIQLANFVAAGSGSERFASSAAIALNPFTCAASGTITIPPITGSAAITLGNFTARQYGAGTIPASGMLGWWDAADAGTITQSANSVSQWNDKSGRGINLAQATSLNRPRRLVAVLNTLNVIQFSYSGARWLTVTFTDIVNTTTLSVFVVIRRDGATANGRAISMQDGAAAEDYSQAGSGIPVYNGTVWPASYRQNAERSKAATEQGTVNYLNLGSVWDGTNHTMYLGGTAQTPVANTGTFSVDKLSIGGMDNGGNSLGITVAEVIMYNRALTTTERQQVESYLQTKWFTSAPAISGTAAIQLANFISNGKEGFSGSAAVQLGNFTCAASGTVVNPVATGWPKVWKGSAWVKAPAKVWNGTSWGARPVKVWTGSTWRTIT